MKAQGNTFIVTKKTYTTIGDDLEAYARLPAVVRAALREAQYEYSAEDAHNILRMVREHMSSSFNAFIRQVDERAVNLEAARHIRDTDLATRRQEQQFKLVDFDGWLASHDQKPVRLR